MMWGPTSHMIHGRRVIVSEKLSIAEKASVLQRLDDAGPSGVHGIGNLTSFMQWRNMGELYVCNKLTGFARKYGPADKKCWVYVADEAVPA